MISSRVAVTLGRALQDALGTRQSNTEDFVKAYDLPPFRLDPQFSQPIVLRPREYVEMVWDGGKNPEGVARIIEALWQEIEGDSPIVLQDRSFYMSSSLPGDETPLRGPPSYVALLRQLHNDGLVFSREGRLTPLDSEAPSERQDRSELAAFIRQFAEIDPVTIIHHIDESDATFENGNWHASANEARATLEGLVCGIALAEAKHRGESIPNYPKQSERRSSFGPCREYLNRIGFLTVDENTLVSGFYSVASKQGSHPGITDEEMAKLVRRHCWVSAQYVIKRFSEWKRRGHSW